MRYDKNNVCHKDVKSVINMIVNYIIGTDNNNNNNNDDVMKSCHI